MPRGKLLSITSRSTVMVSKKWTTKVVLSILNRIPIKMRLELQIPLTQDPHHLYLILQANSAWKFD